MIGNINIDKGVLSGELSSGSRLNGVINLGMNARKYYTKEEIDALFHDLAETVISAETYLEFPITGKTTAVYIDTSANRVYRWDDENVKYYCIGSDYNEIDRIDGGWDRE